MIPKIVRQRRFKKDVKRLQNQKKDFTRLKAVLERLVQDQPLEPRHRDHALQGEYQGFRECHITADWLLIYRKTETSLVLVRSGSLAELFKM